MLFQAWTAEFLFSGAAIKILALYHGPYGLACLRHDLYSV